MIVRQRAYLSIWSEALSPDEITYALRITPDEVALRGSRRPGPPPLPRYHMWKLFSQASEKVRLDDHFAGLVERLQPIRRELGALIEAGDVNAGVCVVRHFNPGPEEEAILSARDDAWPGLTVLPGQHPLLGFMLEPDLLADLAALRLGIAFDEYGDEHE